MISFIFELSHFIVQLIQNSSRGRFRLLWFTEHACVRVRASAAAGRQLHINLLHDLKAKLIVQWYDYWRCGYPAWEAFPVG